MLASFLQSASRPTSSLRMLSRSSMVIQAREWSGGISTYGETITGKHPIFATNLTTTVQSIVSLVSSGAGDKRKAPDKLFKKLSQKFKKKSPDKLFKKLSQKFKKKRPDKPFKRFRQKFSPPISTWAFWTFEMGELFLGQDAAHLLPRMIEDINRYSELSTCYSQLDAKLLLCGTSRAHMLNPEDSQVHNLHEDTISCSANIVGTARHFNASYIKHLGRPLCWFSRLLSHSLRRVAALNETIPMTIIIPMIPFGASDKSCFTGQYHASSLLSPLQLNLDLSPDKSRARFSFGIPKIKIVEQFLLYSCLPMGQCEPIAFLLAPGVQLPAHLGHRPGSPAAEGHGGGGGGHGHDSRTPRGQPANCHTATASAPGAPDYTAGIHQDDADIQQEFTQKLKNSFKSDKLGGDGESIPETPPNKAAVPPLVSRSPVTESNLENVTNPFYTSIKLNLMIVCTRL